MVKAALPAGRGLGDFSQRRCLIPEPGENKSPATLRQRQTAIAWDSAGIEL